MKDILTIMRSPCFRIETVPYILKDRFLVADILAGLAVEFPQDAVFPDGKHELLTAGIHENAFEHDVEIQRFRGSMLEVPLEFAVVGIERKRRAGVESIAFRA